MKDALSQAIEMFENVSKTKVIAIKELGKGTANDIFLINWNYVLRLKRLDRTDAKWNTPSNEIKVLSFMVNLAEKKNVGPLLYAYEDHQGDKIEEFLPSIRDLHDSDSRKRFRGYVDVLSTIKTLHSYKGNFPKFEFHERFDAYKRLSGEKLRSDIEQRIRLKAEDILNNDKQVLCHNDLHAGNIILGEGRRRCYFLDYEFAGVNGDIFDLASFLEENNIDKATCQRLITNYYGPENCTERNMDEVFTVMAYQDMLWYYWAKARYKETMEEVFLDIAKEKMSRISKLIREESR